MNEMNDVPHLDEGRDGEGVDPRLHEILTVLDPSVGDPGYWIRFEQSVLRRASAELARRRAMVDLSVSELVTSWARTVVPTALLAAAAAGIMLLQPGSVGSVDIASPLTIEEALAAGLESDGIPSLLTEALPGDGVLVASESY